MSESTAGGMHRRQSIGPDHWRATVLAARRRGYDGITVELLLALRPQRTSTRRPDKPPAATPGPLFSATG